MRASLSIIYWYVFICALYRFLKIKILININYIHFYFFCSFRWSEWTRLIIDIQRINFWISLFLVPSIIFNNQNLLLSLKLIIKWRQVDFTIVTLFPDSVSSFIVNFDEFVFNCFTFIFAFKNYKILRLPFGIDLFFSSH